MSLWYWALCDFFLLALVFRTTIGDFSFQVSPLQTVASSMVVLMTLEPSNWSPLRSLVFARASSTLVVVSYPSRRLMPLWRPHCPAVAYLGRLTAISSRSQVRIRKIRIFQRYYGTNRKPMAVWVALGLNVRILDNVVSWYISASKGLNGVRSLPRGYS